MNKQNLTFFVALLFSAIITPAQVTQTVQSACTANDTILKKYKNDANRLAVRRVFHINSGYKDTIRIDSTTSNAYRSALVAVHNATALTVRDTLVNLFKVHTDLNPELNTLSVKAPPTLPWMQNLQNSVLPTGNAQVDYLIYKYGLAYWTYFQSGNYDQVVFTSSLNLNLQPLTQSFANISGVIASNIETGFNDVTNITDSVNSAFTLLKYSYGWGTCLDGCDYRSYWTLKVYPTCVVEYLGTSGDPLTLNLPEFIKMEDLFKCYPNPVEDVINIEMKNAQRNKVAFELHNSLGAVIMKFDLEGLRSEVGMYNLSPGFYYLVMKQPGAKAVKFIKK